MPDTPAVDQLTRLGLTTYEAKAYLALIRRDSSSASEVARVARLPRQRIYDVLASLTQKGLATTHPGSPAAYGATAPEAAVSRLLASHRQELASLERQAETMVEHLTPAYREGQTFTDPLEYIEVLRDPRTITERFNELQGNVKREILVFTRPPYALTPAQNVEGLRLLAEHTAKGVYEFSLFDDTNDVDAVRRFIEAGEQARFVAELPLKLAIIDETIVMFGMQDPLAGSADLTMVVVEHPSLAHVLKIAFLAVWEQGLTFDEALQRFGSRAVERKAS